MDGVGPAVVEWRDLDVVDAGAQGLFHSEVGSLAAIVVGRKQRPVAVGEAANRVRASGRVRRQRACLRGLDAEHVDILRIVQQPLLRSAQGELGRVRAGVAVVFRTEAQPIQQRGKLTLHKTRRREVAQVATRQIQQAHHLNGLCSRHIEPPLSLPIPQRALGVLGPRLQLGRGQRQCRAGADGDANRSRSLPPVVQPVDGHAGGRGARVDHPQLGLLVDVAAGVEDGDVVRGVRDKGDIMQRRHEPSRAAHIGERLDHQAAVEGEPPVAAPRADSARQPLVGIAPFQIVRVEVDDPIRLHRERHGRGAVARVVDGADLHRPLRVRVVDDPHKALPDRVRRGHEQRDIMRFGECRQTAENAAQAKGFPQSHLFCSVNCWWLL